MAKVEIEHLTKILENALIALQMVQQQTSKQKS